jgi:hypothetical protein
VFGIRILHRRSPFSPDRNHIHHLLLDRGFSHRAITLTLVAVNFLTIALVFLARSQNCTFLILGVFFLFFTMIAAIYYLLPGPRLFVAKTAKEESAQLTKASHFVLNKDSILEQNN